MDNASPTSEHPTPPSGQPPASGPRVSREEMKDLSRLRRSVTDRRIAGVAGGIARHLDIDAIIVRVALVVAVFFGGAGLLAYIGAWILVPEEGTDDEPLGLDQRSRSLALAGVGVLALLCAVGDWAGAFWFPWPLAIVAAVVVWFLNRKDKPSSGPGNGYGYGYDSGYGHESPTYAGEAAAGQPGAEGTWMPPTSYAREPRGVRQPRNPRRRGPILFFFTLALIALAEGVLGVVDLAGAPVADSAYPALALGIIATMLVVGAFWGRAGGLIALGVVAALVTAGATAGSHFPDDHYNYRPASAGEVRDAYDFGGGEFVLDMSGISDVDGLDGRDITIDGVGGKVEVLVPDGVDVAVRTEVVAGDSRVFDLRNDGFDISVDGFRDGGAEAPAMTITIDLGVGEILVREVH
ncbi:PspC domain-containing protein [Nocardioides astragali]|uniref:PspC domain-containing protein n=1 Tax=Nocardioides astragali TaxID=1776736 RepID=A0ABW2N7X4_9ACTN|nr:PspC domain-containing protein [Nocardioides astragali]